ncbi:MAG TPA: outer membrane beta-barrel protein [Vicinamibacterales bacterium]|nr:outer membrane beta-barrel protein [Vicinamibacterales bacterium]
MFRTKLQPKILAAVTIALLFAAGARAASAQVGQPWTDRGYFNLNAGFESSSGTLSDAVTFTLYGEGGSKRVDQNVDSGALFDFSIGSRVWRNVSVGIGYHRGANTSDATVTASVPHPAIFGLPRSVALTAGDLDRRVRAIHLQVGYMIPLTEDVSVHVTVGPSFFRLTQDVVGDLTFSESSPFTTVSTAPVIENRSDSAAGVNIGADVTYKVWESDAYTVGGGMFLRYSGATARIRVLDNEVDSDVGGLQIGFGARVRF